MRRGLPPALGVGDGSGGGGGGRGGGAPKKPCYFYNHGGCKNADGKCRFEHVHVGDAEKAKMERPTARSQSPQRSPSKGDGQKADGKVPVGNVHCFGFIKGTCTKGGQCRFAHLSQEVVDEMKRAKAKAKAEPKGKAKAKVRLR